MDKTRRSLGPAYVGLFLALVTIVGLLSLGLVFLVILLAMMVYFAWGMHNRIRELEKRLAEKTAHPEQ